MTSRPTTLSCLISERKISPQVVALLQLRLPEAIMELHERDIPHRKLSPETIFISEGETDLSIETGGDERRTEADDIFDYGIILKAVQAALPTEIPLLQAVADACTDENPEQRISTLDELRLSIEKRASKAIYLTIIVVILSLCVLLALFSR